MSAFLGFLALTGIHLYMRVWLFVSWGVLKWPGRMYCCNSMEHMCKCLRVFVRWAFDCAGLTVRCVPWCLVCVLYCSCAGDILRHAQLVDVAGQDTQEGHGS